MFLIVAPLTTNHLILNLSTHFCLTHNTAAAVDYGPELYRVYKLPAEGTNYIDLYINVKYIPYAGGQVKYAKRKIEEEDKVNLKSKYSVIEGNDLADYKLEKISFEHQWRASPNGGSICKTICKLHAKGEVEVTEEQAKAGKERVLGVVKGVEAYLQANPDVCN